MPIQPIVVGGTYDWFLNPASINTRPTPTVFDPWDITGATVTVSFVYYGRRRSPSATYPVVAAYHFTATILSATDGTANYVNEATLFDEPGQWGVSWKVEVSGTVLESDVFLFEVKASAAAIP